MHIMFHTHQKAAPRGLKMSCHLLIKKDNNSTKLQGKMMRTLIRTCRCETLAQCASILSHTAMYALALAANAAVMHLRYVCLPQQLNPVGSQVGNLTMLCSLVTDTSMLPHQLRTCATGRVLSIRLQDAMQRHTGHTTHPVETMLIKGISWVIL